MLLKVTDLDISYGSKATVTGANIELKKGEILSIVGESGSGKTTVIRAIMGCLPGNGHVKAAAISFLTAETCWIIRRSNGVKCVGLRFL